MFPHYTTNCSTIFKPRSVLSCVPDLHVCVFVNMLNWQCCQRWSKKGEEERTHTAIGAHIEVWISISAWNWVGCLQQLLCTGSSLVPRLFPMHGKEPGYELEAILGAHPLPFAAMRPNTCMDCLQWIQIYPGMDSNVPKNGGSRGRTTANFIWEGRYNEYCQVDFSCMHTAVSALLGIVSAV